MNWTQANLQSQFNHATANGWIALFTDIATSAGFPVEFVLAIASRETNMLNIKGDFHDGIYHGFGIMQVDVGTDAAFCNSWTAADVSGSIQRGTQILAQKRGSSRPAESPISSRSPPLTMPGLRELSAR